MKISFTINSKGNITFMRDNLILNEQKKKTKLSKNLKTTIKIYAAILILVFSFLKLKGFPLISISSQFTPEMILHISLALYFFSWAYGPTWFDIYFQELAYTQLQIKKIPISGYFIITLLAIVFGILCYINSYKYFIGALFIFWTIDLLGYLYLKKIIQPTEIKSIENSKKLNEIYQEEIINIVSQHITGKWKTKRYIVGYLLLLVLIIILNFKFFIIQNLPLITDPDLLVSYSILIFIILIEGWTWFSRIKTYICINYLEKLKNKYSITKK